MYITNILVLFETKIIIFNINIILNLHKNILVLFETIVQNDYLCAKIKI